ncbi:MAG: bis(5'-nucleosyl)-tetraphosphatase (symmetrical) YqeK [Clostridia bacterium]|nr:bis(5'-nucleosyl)-tetraphosphatase (symmetrical) YqeK [Clostridia bacterium]
MKFDSLKERVASFQDAATVEIIEMLCNELDADDLYDHMEHVANLAGELAQHYRLNVEEAFLTGFLHDVGRLIDQEEYLELMERFNMPFDENEEKVIDVLHGKVSYLVAKEIFNISSEHIHNAILYHTTLRKSATDFEKIMFLADKMTWTYDDLVFAIEETVLQNLNVACYNSLEWIINHVEKRQGLLLDRTKEAYQYFKGMVLL